MPQITPLDPGIQALLAGGCALIIGTVGPDGEPQAARGWGLDILPDDPPDDSQFVVRVILDAADTVTLAHLDAESLVAITGTDVPTLRSVQLKGRPLGVEAATDRDRERAARFCDAFFGDVVRTDATPWALVERLEPYDYVVLTAAITDVFDQTPGPAAGASISRS